MKITAKKHFDEIAGNYDYYKSKNLFYYRNLKTLLGNLIPNDKKVFEVGCGTGDLLVSLEPKYGFGTDISSEMIRIAKAKHSKESQIYFSTDWPKQGFDYIFMSDVIEHLEKPEEIFNKISKLMSKNTIFINTMANPVWEPLLMFAEKMGLKMPEGPHQRLAMQNLELIIKSSKLKIIKHDYKLLLPIEIPLLTNFANKYLEKYFKRLAFIDYFVAVKS